MKNEVLNTIFGSCPIDMSDADVLDAMKSIPGYLDITPGDFKEIFRFAYRHAIERIAQSMLAKDVMTVKLISAPLWLTSAVAVATAIAVMHATKTLHPPGGATALIAVIGSQKIHNLGYLYVIVPAGVGPFIMLVVALLVNNLPQNRRYPEFWL